MKPILRSMLLALSPVFMSVAMPLAHAQATSSFDKSSGGSGHAYPSGALRIVVPYAPGGGTDILGRAIAAAGIKGTL